MRRGHYDAELLLACCHLQLLLLLTATRRLSNARCTRPLIDVPTLLHAPQNCRGCSAPPAHTESVVRCVTCVLVLLQHRPLYSCPVAPTMEAQVHQCYCLNPRKI
jgi:hypothetical protein